MLLLLVKLVDDLILVSNFIIQAPNLVIPVGLFLLKLLDGQLQVLNVLLDDNIFLLQCLLVSSGLLSVSFHGNELFTCTNECFLSSILLRIHLGLLVMVLRQVALLSFNLLHQSLPLNLEGDNVFFQSCLGVELLLIGTISIVCLLFQHPQLILQVDLANEWPGLLDDDEPSPVSERHELPEVPLDNLHKLPLVPLLGKALPCNGTKDFTLQPSDQLQDNTITSLLKASQSSSPEEDLGVSKTIPVT